MRSRHPPSSTIDLYDKQLTLDFGLVAFDVIAATTYGKRLGFLDSGEDVNNIICRLDARMDVVSPVGSARATPLTCVPTIPSADGLIQSLTLWLAISDAMA